MKKSIFKTGALLGCATLLGASVNAQIIDQKDVTITMDLQPILQLDMETPDQIEFVFDDIYDYIGGIIRYGGTVLKVSSTVAWDLAAFGVSSTDDNVWDVVMSYGRGGGATPNATDSICTCALELHQNPANPDPNTNGGGGFTQDYSTNFGNMFSAGAANAGVSTNSLFVNANGSLTLPAENESRMIAGGTNDVATPEQFAVAAGSYLAQTGNSSNYYFTIDYRIWPSLPPTFPNSFMLDGQAGTPQDNAVNAGNFIAAAGTNAYVEPGVYTMSVEYMLMEDQ